MLAAERALARAQSLAGSTTTRSRAEGLDAERRSRAKGRRAGNPVEPLVRRLRDAIGRDSSIAARRARTSLDTAAMLVARDATAIILDELDGVAARAQSSPDEHRATVMAARTLLQQAVPTTFGLKAASWLVGVVHARERLAASRLPAQLGGAAGTLAALGDDGLDVLRAFAEELDLPEPVLPWHTRRLPLAELGAALAVAAGFCAKIALDLALLAQTEVGEVRLPEGGGSSTMPHKRNPVGPVLTRACAEHVRAAAGVLCRARARARACRRRLARRVEGALRRARVRGRRGRVAARDARRPRGRRGADAGEPERGHAVGGASGSRPTPASPRTTSARPTRSSTARSRSTAG